MTLSSVLVFIKIKITIVRPLQYIPVKDNNDASTVTRTCTCWILPPKNCNRSVSSINKF